MKVRICRILPDGSVFCADEDAGKDKIHVAIEDYSDELEKWIENEGQKYYEQLFFELMKRIERLEEKQYKSEWDIKF